MTRRSSPSFAVGGIEWDPETNLMEAPPWGWTCFHCGAHFNGWLQARRHFGDTPDDLPACISVAERMVAELRCLASRSLDLLPREVVVLMVKIDDMQRARRHLKEKRNGCSDRRTC